MVNVLEVIFQSPGKSLEPLEREKPLFGVSSHNEDVCILGMENRVIVVIASPNHSISIIVSVNNLESVSLGGGRDLDIGEDSLVALVVLKGAFVVKVVRICFLEISLVVNSVGVASLLCEYILLAPQTQVVSDRGSLVSDVPGAGEGAEVEAFHGSDVSARLRKREGRPESTCERGAEHQAKHDTV